MASSSSVFNLPPEITLSIHAAWQDAFHALNRDQPDVRGLLDVAHAWDLAIRFLEPRNLEGLNWNDRDHTGILPAFRLLAEAGKSEELLRHFYDDVKGHFHLIVRDITRAMRRIQESASISAKSQLHRILADLFDRLVAWQQAWAAPLAAFEDPSLRQTFHAHFISLLHLSFPPSFPSLIHKYFLSNFHPLEDLSNASSDACAASPSPHLHRLGILARFGPDLASIAYKLIGDKVRTDSEMEWFDRKLESLRSWSRDVVGAWWRRFYVGQENIDGIMKPVYARLDYHACKSLADLRMTELFDIIVQYPDTLPALEDLKDCLMRVDCRAELVVVLKAANVKRLLHPGADTKDIIAQYVSMIRCLRIIDPPGVLLQKVSEPIRKFLKNRTDTIKCIVSALVNPADDSSEHLELDEDGDIKALEDRDDREEDYTDPNWVPEPIDAAPEFRTGNASDIISTLVSIYDTREVIVKELQILLAQKLLVVKDYDLEQEIRTVEILKLRFGEAALQVCEVMLKDIADSKRVDQHIQSQPDSRTQIHPKIVSRLFWPKFQATGFALPDRLALAQARYAKHYHRFKPDKRLRWLPQLGTVEIKLELQDRVVEVEASALQAAVIELFGGDASPTWSTDDLRSQLKLSDEAVLLNALKFWVHQGVLGMTVDEGGGGGGRWKVLEHKEDEAGMDEVEMRNNDPSPLESLASSEASQMRVFWAFIQGMLNSLGGLPLDRIHDMLGFAPSYDRTEEQLGEFMEALRREGAVERKGDGSWILK